MTTFLMILILITAVLLVLVVLIQNPKGGGLSSQFAASNQIMGVKRTAETVEKLTWSLAIVLMVLVMSTSIVNKPSIEEQQSAIQEQIDNTPIPNAPNFNQNTPTPSAPAEQK
jgi:preprotein translocase subunit SecG